ncbi:MAG TPA: hypothetical protein VE172_16270 [Stackebrandtia sp.]|jgi:Tol biopolymer transport system component|uniref:TolB family protein n=1 Tax=Stackebrandtia sp. TaxID=2023065 RepID=UPI002D3E0CF8|nr:hypothetical protein [Stackebrandtia sp.]HZE40358.1 hypothetical protein [Stackebrandtia sp.]
MTEELHDDLTDMAGKVLDVDMRDRVLAGSRRLGRQRAVAACAAAVVAAALAVVGAVSVYGQNQAMPTDRPLPTGTVDKLEGTFYSAIYGQGDAASGGQPGVNDPSDLPYRWKPGDKTMTDIGLDDQGMFYYSAALSPDGQRFAYMTSDSQGDQFRVMDVGGEKRTVLTDFSGWEDVCSTPQWTSDGERVFVDRGAGHGDQRFGFIDLNTKKFTPSAQPPGCDVRLARVHGQDVMFSLVNKGKATDVYRTTPDGKSVKTDVSKVLGRTKLPYANALTAVSPDGRFVCVNASGTAGHQGFTVPYNFCNVIVDTANGDLVKIPQQQKTANQQTYAQVPAFVFAIPGRLLVTTDGSKYSEIGLYDYRGKKLDRYTEARPSSDGDLTYIGFAPKGD